VEEQPALDITRLHFIDESGFTTNMVRRCGRCPIGQRLPAKAPHGHWRTTTFLAALRHDGIAAPMTLDGPMDGETFKAWTEQFLAPVLKPGDLVIMDNLPAHKVTGIREAIEAQDAHLLYLPAPGPSPGQALQSRSQSHRTGLRQVQGIVAKSRRPHR